MDLGRACNIVLSEVSKKKDSAFHTDPQLIITPYSRQQPATRCLGAAAMLVTNRAGAVTSTRGPTAAQPLVSANQIGNHTNSYFEPGNQGAHL